GDPGGAIALWVIKSGSVPSEVTKLAKRLVPIVAEAVPPANLPPEIGAVHLMPFDSSANFEIQVEKLENVLLTDRAWVIEHTRLSALAQRWSEGKRSRDALLVGSELTARERWLSRPTKGALATDPLLQAYLSESRASAGRTQRIRTRIATLVAAGALTLA